VPLADLLAISNQKKKKKIGISEERMRAVLAPMRDYVAFWREYPDLFVDFMSTGWNSERTTTFHLFSY
jgi:hypothetical protein